MILICFCWCIFIVYEERGCFPSGWGTANMTEESVKRVEPVFFLNNEVDQLEGKWLNTLEVCLSVCDVISNENSVEGAQRIGGLWRVYVTDEETRVNLLSTGINLRGNQVALKDKNPFLNLWFENIETTRLFIRNIPLSYDNKEIEKSLKDKGVHMLGPLKYARARTLAGKLTNFKTGDRFVDIEIPKEPLPKKQAMGVFTASLYHKEQNQSKEEVECGNCRQKGHIRRDCKNEPVCYDCLQTGHKKGSEVCLKVQKDFETQSLSQKDDEEEDTFVDAGNGTDYSDDNEESDEGDDNDEDEVEIREREKRERDEESNLRNMADSQNVQSVVAGKLTEIKQSSTESADSASKKSASQNKGEQKLLTSLWKASSEHSPRGSPSCSPSRIRKVDDRSPEDPEQKQVRKGKKHKKVK